MVKYLKRQEELVEEALSKDNCSDWESLRNYHKSQLNFCSMRDLYIYW